MDNELDPSVDATLIAQALERPHSRYLQWAERPDVVKALAMFRSERDIRKTGRLDLVTWVQYICGFGYPGPPDEAWASLFAACRVLPMLGADSDYLREPEIAVLLAYAKIKPDHGDTMTAAQLVKHRIKPAVLGRTVARTPGILQHIHVKFENWALGPFSDMFCSNCVSLCGPSSYMPGIDDLPTTQVDIGDSIRQCADAHANTLLKTWGGVVTTILDIEGDTTSQRARRFHQKLIEKRKYIYQHIFIKISEYWFNLTHSRACVPMERNSLHYRQNPYVSQKPSKGTRLLVAEDKGTCSSKLRSLVKKIISSPPIPRSFPSWATITAELTIFELHRPSTFGQASIEFFQCDGIKTDVVKLVSPEQFATNSKGSMADIRIGNFNSATITAGVWGVPPCQSCRALRLTVSLGVLPPKAGSDRPSFQITGINGSTWAELHPLEDKCIECEAVTVLNFREGHVEDKVSRDCMNGWFRSVGIGNNLSLGTGIQFDLFDICEGMTLHELQVSVPEQLLKRVRKQTKTYDRSPHSISQTYLSEPTHEGTVSSSVGATERPSPEKMSIDSESAEQFSVPLWIDCHTGAKISYSAPEGVELFAVTPNQAGMFKKSPYWKWRKP